MFTIVGPLFLWPQTSVITSHCLPSPLLSHQLTLLFPPCCQCTTQFISSPFLALRGVSFASRSLNIRTCTMQLGILPISEMSEERLYPQFSSSFNSEVSVIYFKKSIQKSFNQFNRKFYCVFSYYYVYGGCTKIKWSKTNIFCREIKDWNWKFHILIELYVKEQIKLVNI